MQVPVANRSLQRKLSALFLLALLLPGLRAQKIAGEVPLDKSGNLETAQAAVSLAPEAMKSITANELKKQVMYFASEELEGRLTGTRGQILAAQHFAKAFESLGLAPLGGESGGDKEEGGSPSYFQSYDITLFKLERQGTGLFDATGKRVIENGAFFLYNALLKKGKQDYRVEGNLVFGGGIRGRDLEGLDLQDKILVVASPRRPRKRATVYTAMGEMFRFTPKLRSIGRKAKKAGAVGCIVLFREYDPALLQIANNTALWPGRPRVSRGHVKGITGMDRMFAGLSKDPVFVCAGKDAALILKRLNLEPDDVFRSNIEDRFIGQAKAKKFKLTAKAKIEHTKALNTVALLEGTHADLKKEAIVYSCHMDHLGLTMDGGAFYGADDNGSGSATVLEIAEAFAKLKGGERPQRSIIFLAVSGEELGLWGSAHYVKHATWDLDKIVANINMDMLGRNTKKVPQDAISVTPTNRHRSYNSLALEAAWLGKGLGLEMRNGDRFYQRSDHVNFAKRGIPIVFFCDDEHPDYHMPTDTADKLDYPKLERVARLAFLIGYRNAMRPEKPEAYGAQKDWFSAKDH